MLRTINANSSSQTRNALVKVRSQPATPPSELDPGIDISGSLPKGWALVAAFASGAPFLLIALYLMLAR